MGGSAFSDDEYAARAKTRATRVSSGGSAFAYTDAVHTGKASRDVHADMDPKRVAGAASAFAGKVMRESRDSATHPETLAVAVLFDVTGSMGRIPVTLAAKLKTLLALLTQKGVKDAQILFGAIGDAYSDQAPLQIGQFESGNEMDDDLDKIWVEGGGGGQIMETYDLGHYFVAYHTDIDCYLKRGQKGYVFTMGDEAPYGIVEKEHVAALIGDTIEADMKTADILFHLNERYHVFHIIVEEGSYKHDKTIEKKWTDLLGERVLKLEDQNNIAELIALTIALTEGVLDIDGVSHTLTDHGASDATVKDITQALVPLAKVSKGMTKATLDGELPEMAESAPGVTRL